MKYGINTLLWTANFDRPHLSLLPRIKEGGFDGVEIARFGFDEFPAAEIRRELERAGLEATFCTALTGQQSVICEDAERRTSTLDFLKQAIRAAAESGADRLIGPFCSGVGYLCGRRRTTDEWKRAVDSLQSLGDTLDEYRVTLCLEPLNRFETYFLNTVQDGLALCDEINHPRVGLMLDTFHANIEEKSIGEATRLAARHLKHVHACENDRGIPGTGHIEWASVFRNLEMIRYNDWVVIESFGAALPEIAGAACIWRDLAPVSDDIAFEGVKFLKQQVGAATAA